MSFFSFLDDLNRQSFKRSPTTTERARFRRYGGRIRELRGRGVLGFLSAEVLSAVQLHTIDKALLPNMRTLLFLGIEGLYSSHCSFPQDRLRIARVLWIQRRSVITDLARAMPKLETLQFSDSPCWTPTGVTTRGLTALVHYCPRLSYLRIHSQASSLDPSKLSRAIRSYRSTVPPDGCALTSIDVGFMSRQTKFTSKVTQTPLRIFPRLSHIKYMNEDWREVVDALNHRSLG